ncbi:hypothetical protein DFH08DRAFT_685138, partial [Mycena albidolilacea]
CRMGCDAIENVHHIFVHCRRYDAWRTRAADKLHKWAKAKLTEKGFEEVDWHVPNFDHLLPLRNDLSKLAFTCLTYHFSADWHTTSIRLARRIWGNWQKETVVTLDVCSRRR